jgi:hypothetical protein
LNLPTVQSAFADRIDEVLIFLFGWAIRNSE